MVAREVYLSRAGEYFSCHRMQFQFAASIVPVPLDVVPVGVQPFGGKSRRVAPLRDSQEEAINAPSPLATGNLVGLASS